MSSDEVQSRTSRAAAAVVVLIAMLALKLRNRAWSRWKHNGEKQLEVMAGVGDV